MYRELYALAERNALLGLVYYVALNAYYKDIWHTLFSGNMHYMSAG